MLVLPPAAGGTRDKVPADHKGALPIALPEKYKLEARENGIKIELPTGSPRS